MNNGIGTIKFGWEYFIEILNSSNKNLTIMFHIETVQDRFEIDFGVCEMRRINLMVISSKRDSIGMPSSVRLSRMHAPDAAEYPGSCAMSYLPRMIVG